MKRRRQGKGWSIEQLFFGLLVAATLYLLLVDGFLRLKTGHKNLTVLRDVFPALVLLVGLAHMATSPGTRLWRFPMAGLVLAWVLCTVVQLWNPSTTGVFRGAQALKPHLEFVPFFFAAAVALTTRRRLTTLMLVIVCAGAVNGAVSLYQSQLTPEQMSSWGPGYKTLITDDNPRAFADNSGVERVRPPALGSDAGFGGILGMLALPCALGLALVEARTRRWLAVATVPLLLTAVVASQTRAGVVAAAVASLAFLLILSLRRGGFRVLVTAALIGLAAIYAGNELVSGRVTTDRYSTIAPADLVGTYSSARGGGLALVGKIAAKYPLGAGLGTGGPATHSGSSLNAGKVSAETEFNYVTAETGVIGLLVMALLFLTTAGRSLRLARRPLDRALAPLFCAIFAGISGMILLWFAGPVTSAPPISALFWIYAGITAAWVHRSRRAGSAGHAAWAPTSQREPAPVQRARATAGVASSVSS
ncbi:MAG: hypothetical protein QOE11_3658 [Solirubrobacteraceae bacterium]|nr:hypothetical protein [Solirubrobacteraceae bacterium]